MTLIPTRIPRLRKDQAVLLSAKEELPEGHLEALANQFEAYLKEAKGPVVIAIDSRFELLIVKSDSIAFKREKEGNDMICWNCGASYSTIMVGKFTCPHCHQPATGQFSRDRKE